MNTLPALSQNIDAEIRFAELIATAKTIPAHFRNSPGDCLLVIQQAIQWGMNPAALLRECSAISGQLMVSGKAIAAAVNANPNLASRLTYTFSGEGDARKVLVSGRYKDESEPRTVEVELRHARTGNDVWKKQPDQQLVYTGARVWARRHAPDIVMGVRADDEIDLVEEAPRTRVPIGEPAGTTTVEFKDEKSGQAAFPEASESGPRTLERIGDDFRDFGQKLIAGVRGEKSDEAIDQWLELNKPNLTAMLESHPKMHSTLMHSINEHRAELH